MKIAVIDFDGTLFKKKGGGISIQDTLAIHKWQMHGGKFIIATGRCLSILKQDIDYDVLMPDCYICSNGATVFNNNFNLIFKKYINYNIVQAILDDKFLNKCDYIVAFCPLDTVLHIRNKRAKIALWGKILCNYSIDALRSLTCISQMLLGIGDINKAKNTFGLILECFGKEVNCKLNRYGIEVLPLCTNKVTGIEMMNKYMGWHDPIVYAIGNGGNDIEMIERFSGFSIEEGDDDLKKKAVGVCSSVGELLLSKLHDK